MKYKSFSIRTTDRGQIFLVTGQIEKTLQDLSARTGICTIVTPHTTCALSVNENADPEVRSDLIRGLRAMLPNIEFRHNEGNSDAHLLSAIIGTSLSWPYENGKLILGTWQGVYFIELDGPRERQVTVYVT